MLGYLTASNSNDNHTQATTACVTNVEEDITVKEENMEDYMEYVANLKEGLIENFKEEGKEELEDEITEA